MFIINTSYKYKCDKNERQKYRLLRRAAAISVIDSHVLAFCVYSINMRLC